MITRRAVQPETYEDMPFGEVPLPEDYPPEQSLQPLDTGTRALAVQPVDVVGEAVK